MPFPLKLSNATVAPNAIYPELTGFKFLVLGHGGHGKDTIGRILENVYGMTSCSSSWFACERVVQEKLEQVIGEYPSTRACYEDRSNHREFWYNAISEYNSREPDRLAVDLLEQYDVYTGMRNPIEFGACWASDLFDAIFWISANNRVELEDKSSMQIKYHPKHMRFINNSGSIERAERDLAHHMEDIIERAQKTDLGANR